jgi:hypothetical protein
MAKWMTKTLHRNVASIPWLQSSLNFFMNGILICQHCSQYLNCSSISNVLLPIFSALILSWITISRHDHRLTFLSIYFWYFNSKPNHSDLSTSSYWNEIGANCNRNHLKVKKTNSHKMIWHSQDRASWYILIIKPTRCTNFSNIFLE